MRQPIAVFSLAAVVAATLVCCGAPPPPKDFAEQVSRGQSVYGSYCSDCHGDAGEGTEDGPRVVGLKEGALPLEPPATRKVRKTHFVTAADVLDFATKNMPAKEPGSLTPDQYLDVVAFALKANGVDLGKEVLTAHKARELKIPR